MLILFVAVFGGVIVFHLLEPLAPIMTGYRTGPKRRGYNTDWTSALVNGPFLSALTQISGFWLATMIPSYSQLMTPWPWLVQFAVLFLVNDFGRYWLHRWYHDFDFLWRIHRVHHAVVEMDCLSVIRFHVLEGIVKNFLLFVPFQALGIEEHVIPIFSAIDILKGYWHHANLKTYIGPLNYVLNSAEQHWWHHSTEQRGQRSNYGSVLSVWDWLFKTAYWPRGQWPEKIGVGGLENFPDTYLEQMTSIRFDDDRLYEVLQGEVGTPAVKNSPDPAVLSESPNVPSFVPDNSAFDSGALACDANSV